MMSIDMIEQDFQATVSSQVKLVAEGVSRYRVFTRFGSMTAITCPSC